MVKMEQIQTGLAKFIDRDIAPSLNGWDRVIVAGGGGLIAAKLPALLGTYANNPIFAALGVFDAENNEIDIDALYSAMKPYLGADAMPIKIPALNITMKIGRKELDNLMAYIKEEDYE